MIARRGDAPLRLLMSRRGAELVGDGISAALAGQPWVQVLPDAPQTDCDIAFVSRDVTGLSTKHEILPATRVFYDAMLAAPSLRWVHIHSAGADRAVDVTLAQRGVEVTTSSGVNAGIVAQGAIAAMLALARHLPKMLDAQRAHRWTSLMASGLPRDIEGQRAVIVGWGPIAQQLAVLLDAFGIVVSVARRASTPAGERIATVPYRRLGELLPDADWLIACCPLSDETRRLIDASMLARLPPTAYVVNVARGEIVDEAALIAALRNGSLAGAYLDVFEHEPLAADSPLWDLPNVIVTPHSAGLSDGNERRVAELFLERLARWTRPGGSASVVPAAAVDAAAGERP